MCEELSLERLKVQMRQLAAQCIFISERDLKPTFIAIERHAAWMVESSPALALVLVQHKSMANDGGALGGRKQAEKEKKRLANKKKRKRKMVSVSKKRVEATKRK